MLVLQIQPGFAELLRKGQTAPVQAVLDGTDSNTALIAVGYINQIAARFAQDYQLQLADRLKPSLATFAPNIELQERPWYNANLESRWFFVPGVIGTLVLVSVMTLTAFAVVREREIGTLEQLMVTPISPTELIVGKTLPFLIVGLANVVFVAILGSLWFQVPFRGNVFVLLLGTTLFLSSALGVGLLISTRLPDPTAGFCDLVLLHLAGDHAVRIRLSDHQHADGAAIFHQSRSAALLSDRPCAELSSRGSGWTCYGRRWLRWPSSERRRSRSRRSDFTRRWTDLHIGSRADAGPSLAIFVWSLPLTPNLLMTCASFAGVPTGVAQAVPAHTNASGTPFAALDSNIARAAAGIAVAPRDPIRSASQFSRDDNSRAPSSTKLRRAHRHAAPLSRPSRRRSRDIRAPARRRDRRCSASIPPSPAHSPSVRSRSLNNCRRR